jgi:hypothetical protein
MDWVCLYLGISSLEEVAVSHELSMDGHLCMSVSGTSENPHFSSLPEMQKSAWFL